MHSTQPEACVKISSTDCEGKDGAHLEDATKFWDIDRRKFRAAWKLCETDITKNCHLTPSREHEVYSIACLVHCRACFNQHNQLQSILKYDPDELH